MSTSRWGLLALCLGAATVSVTHAKPPDLPSRGEVRCEEGDTQPQRNADASAVRRTTELPEQSAAFAPGCIDGWSQSVLPFLLQRIGWQMHSIMQPGAGESVQVPQRDASAGVVLRGGAFAVNTTDPELNATAEQARELYELASRFARQGKLERARQSLRQAHLANPTCRFGRLAIERLQELERVDTDEESSEPTPRSGQSAPSSEESTKDDGRSNAERTFRRMRQTTQPLGLVPATTY